jgi:N-hydroxyarylamine O-acetyltransferase
MIDLDLYCERIGYRGQRSPDLATLRAVHALHPAALPFENLDPLLGRPVSLDVGALEEKMLRRKRGGYCFEQNVLLRSALQAIGFRVMALAARVLWMMPPEAPPNPRTHTLLLVETEEGPFLADAGFGGHLLDAPLALVAGAEQRTPAATYRLRAVEDGFVLEALLPRGWHDVYRFTLEPQQPIDYEVGNWFTSTHPKSRFRHSLLLERLMPGLRVSLFNRRLTRRPAKGAAEERILATADALEAVLRAEFGIEPPADAAEIFARVPPP